MVTDEPIFENDPEKQRVLPSSEDPISDRIRRLMAGQLYGVLCTQGEGQPYGSLVAFSYTEDLSSMVFATPVATRKYRLLKNCSSVALVIDSRSKFPDEMMKVEAITATGRATEVTSKPDLNRFGSLLIQRHPHLESFVNSSSSAVFGVDIIRYLHVSRFQEVRQWLPNAP